MKGVLVEKVSNTVILFLELVFVLSEIEIKNMACCVFVKVVFTVSSLNYYGCLFQSQIFLTI